MSQFVAKKLQETMNGTPQGASELKGIVMPQCRTCTHWVMHNPGTDMEFPFCHELQYWLPSVTGYVHTPSDFACAKHSSLTGDEANNDVPAA